MNKFLITSLITTIFVMHLTTKAGVATDIANDTFSSYPAVSGDNSTTYHFHHTKTEGYSLFIRKHKNQHSNTGSCGLITFGSPALSCNITCRHIAPAKSGYLYFTLTLSNLIGIALPGINPILVLKKRKSELNIMKKKKRK